MIAKGILHVHSTFSYDGKMSLPALRDLCIEKGLSFCFLSEHTDHLTVANAQLFAQECRALSTGSFIFIPGFEVPYKVNAKDREGALGYKVNAKGREGALGYLPAQASKNAHILLFGTEVFLGQTADASLLKQWSSAASLTVLAHPVRNKFIVDDTMKEILDGVEIWNQQYEGKRVPRTRSVRLLRTLQKENQKLLAVGGLDFHRVDHMGTPVCTVDISQLTRASIVEAMQTGMYTFGTEKVSVSSLGIWQGNNSLQHRLVSLFSIITIVCGKIVNAVLSYFGFRLPKGIVRFIRKRV